MTRLILLSIGLCSVWTYSQSVPTLINYQGQLQDPKGQPLATGDYVLTFSIFDAASGGKRIWGPQVFDGRTSPGYGAKIPVVQGYFNAMLGPVDTAGLNITAAFDQPQRFVELQVGDGPPISPRQQILSSPFAIRSGFADSASKANTADLAVRATRADVADRAAIAETVANAGSAENAKTSDMAKDSVKLAGFDWSALFGVNDPVKGLIQGARLAEGSVGFSRLASREISANGEEGSIAISPPAVASDAANPERGFRCATPTVVDVAGLTVSLKTTGRPVLLALVPDVPKKNRSEAPTSLEDGREQNLIWVLSAGGDNYGYVFFVADGAQVAMHTLRAGPLVHESVAGSSLHQLVALPKGHHTFKVQVAYRGTSASGLEVHNLRLLAFEL